MKTIAIVSALVLCLAVSAHGSVTDDLSTLVGQGKSVNPTFRMRLDAQARLKQIKQFSKVAANAFSNMKNMAAPTASFVSGPRRTEHGRLRALATFDYSGCAADVATTQCKAAADNFVAGECWKLGDALEAFFTAGSLTDAQSSLIVSECSKCATAFDKALRTCSGIFQCATAPGYKQPTAQEVKLWAVQAGPLTRAVCSTDSSGNNCAVSLKTSITNLSTLSNMGTADATKTITQDWAASVCTQCMSRFAKAVAFSNAGVRKIKGTTHTGTTSGTTSGSSSGSTSSGSSSGPNMDFPTSVRVMCIKSGGKYCLPEVAKGIAEISAIGTKLESATSDFNSALNALKQMISLICGNPCMRRMFHLMGDRNVSQMMSVFCTKNENGNNCIISVFESLKAIVESGDLSKAPKWLIQGDSCYNRQGTCVSSCTDLYKDTSVGCCSGTFLAMTSTTNYAMARRCNYGVTACPRPSKPASAKLATKISYATYLKKKAEMDAAAKSDVSEATGAPESDITVEGKESGADSTGGTRLLASNVDFVVTISSEEADAQDTYAAALKEEVSSNTLVMPSTSVVVSEETGENPDTVAVVDTSASTVSGSGASALTVSMVAVVIAALFAILF
eukprot:TRINITY_DN28314_c0_g1_i1.p1 TRINITY_DN28314_c0_g1~~TRINITY_DN28314_c0_g1_i1.p1  ORF type:complete len:627 (-),score=210.01 TRINITY_DN28314_c0_g1_i1:139-1995(-)